jgi:hypothetical protein
MKFRINTEDLVDRDEVRHGTDQYDYSWREDHHYSYNGAVIVVDSTYGDIELFPREEEVGAGDEIHVVYVEYDTGDSFGISRGNRSHLWAFADKTRAQALVDAIQADHATNPDYDFDNGPMKFDGVPINCNEWKGYFEHLRRVAIETIVVRRR